MASLNLNPPTAESGGVENVSAVLCVTEAGATLYANREMLLVLAKRLSVLAEAPEDEYYEIHFPSDFYSSVDMFHPATEKNVKILLSKSLAALFNSLPIENDITGDPLTPSYGLTIMSHRFPEKAAAEFQE